MKYVANYFYIEEKNWIDDLLTVLQIENSFIKKISNRIHFHLLSAYMDIISNKRK